MDFAFSQRSQKLQEQLHTFMAHYVVPRIRQHKEEIHAGNFPVSFMEELKQQAKAEGLWNLFLPALRDDEPGTRLSNLEYAPLAEIMGRVTWSSEVFNCNAPDTGNMELLHMFATAEQRQRWLEPMLNGDMRSAFCMTEPDVASSDATNITCSIIRDGNDYVINGRKWFSTNAAHPRCDFYIVMGKTNPDADSHTQQSMIIVPRDSVGVTVERNIETLNHQSPEGHCEIVFRHVRVPASNLLGEEGSGFALAQARLGPGRVHHCMRSIGAAELALELMTERCLERKSFGKYLFEHGSIAEWIAKSRIEIEQARLLVLKTAWMIDEVGTQAARKEIAMIKAVAPALHTTVVDRAIQIFGAMGLTNDTPLAEHYTWGRCLRIADGPDEVHLQSIARMEIKNAKQHLGRAAKYLTPSKRQA
ncbi:Acyl-CoA dehydrogenase [Thalassocella blandensis]|nr:Acyl-CoA dehydrogenase [Thalassocella blandensis]